VESKLAQIQVNFMVIHSEWICLEDLGMLKFANHWLPVISSGSLCNVDQLWTNCVYPSLRFAFWCDLVCVTN